MVAAGLYKDVATAIRALALEQVERKVAAYREQVQAFERKYCHSLEEHSRIFEGQASMEEEDEWMEWKGAAVMLEAWQRAPSRKCCKVLLSWTLSRSRQSLPHRLWLLPGTSSLRTRWRIGHKIRCQLLRPAYQLEIRLIQTEEEILYSYQLFTDRPLLRWDNAPHFPALQSFPHHFHEETDRVQESSLTGNPLPL